MLIRQFDSQLTMCNFNHSVKLDNTKLQHLLRFISDLQTKVKKNLNHLEI